MILKNKRLKESSEKRKVEQQPKEEKKLKSKVINLVEEWSDDDVEQEAKVENKEEAQEKFIFEEKTGNLFHSKDSLAHCVSEGEMIQFATLMYIIMLSDLVFTTSKTRLINSKITVYNHEFWNCRISTTNVQRFC